MVFGFTKFWPLGLFVSEVFLHFLHLNTFVYNNLDLVYFFRKKEYILTLTEHFLYFLDFIFIRTDPEH